MGCGEIFVKYILYITNTIFALAGIALIAVGAGCLVMIPSTELGFENSHTMGSAATIVIGTTILLIAIFGCFGGMTRSHCMLVTYTICMIVLMILKLTLSVLIFVNLNYVKDRVVELLNKAFTDANMKSVDLVQQSLQCCGTTGPGSYGLQLILFALPESCCPPSTQTCSVATAYTTGCNDAMRHLVDVFGTGVGVIAIISVCISLVAIVFSLCLAKHINKNKIRRYQYAGVHNY